MVKKEKKHSSGFLLEETLSQEVLPSDVLPITKRVPLTNSFRSQSHNTPHSENSGSTAQHSLLVCSKEGKVYRKFY